MPASGVIEFTRELLAAALASILTRQRSGQLDPGYEGSLLDLPEFQIENLPALGRIQLYTLATAGEPRKIFDTNVVRRRCVIQNRGPGLIAIATAQEDLAAGVGAGGLLLMKRDYMIDEMPDVHRGEWWAVTDSAGTSFVAGEVS